MLSIIPKLGSLSQVTRSNSQFNQEIGDDVTNEKIIKQIFELKHAIKLLRLENEIIERTITRVDPALMHGIQQALEYAMKLQSSSTSIHSQNTSKTASKFGIDSSRTHSLHSTSRSRLLTSPSSISGARRTYSTGKVSGTVIFGTGPKVNILERTELVNNELEIMAEYLDKAKKKAAKQHAMLKAQLEECATRVVEIDRASQSFQQEVIVDGWDKIAQRIPAELWIRYMNEWTKITDKQIGKLRLRTSTLNSQFSKLKNQIKFKEELSESLRPVDFEKLRIENSQCVLEIEQKVQQLLELKQMTGAANLNLAVHKKAMMEQNKFLDNVINSIKFRHKLAKDLNKEREAIQVQVDILTVRLNEVKEVRQTYEVPDIMEYVQIKADLHDMKQIIKRLENRLHLKQISVASLNREMKSMLVISEQ